MSFLQSHIEGSFREPSNCKSFCTQTHRSHAKRFISLFFYCDVSVSLGNADYGDRFFLDVKNKILCHYFAEAHETFKKRRIQPWDFFQTAQ